MALERGPLPQIVRSNVRALREREVSPANHKGSHPWVPIPETPPSVPQPKNIVVQMHQFELLVWQVQNLTVAVWNMQQTAAGAIAPSPPL